MEEYLQTQPNVENNFLILQSWTIINVPLDRYNFNFGNKGLDEGIFTSSF